MTATHAGSIARKGGRRRMPYLRKSTRERPSLLRQAGLQALCLGILLTVMFPVLWVFSVSLDPLNRSRPEGLNLIPSGATFDAYAQVIAQPTNNPISFFELALNSLKIAVGTSLISVLIGVSAAYAGVAGSLYVIATNGFAQPQEFGVTLSLQLLIGAAVAGLGSLWGVLAGAAFVGLLPTISASAPLIGSAHGQDVVFGLIVILIMLLLPNGVVGVFAGLGRRRQARP